MHYEKLFTRKALYDAQNDGFVRINLHDDLPLGVCTYTEKAQFENHWNEVTLNCRGLVIDFETGEIVGLTLPKFFNSVQHDARPAGPDKMDNRGWMGPEWRKPLPDEPFEIFEKVDGSLITVFNYAGRWMTASKGSFVSDQARWAQARINKRQYAFQEGLTYIAEAIYPENRIVVDYKGREDLVLLAVRRNSDGSEPPLDVVANSWRGVGSVVRTFGKTKALAVLENAAAQGKTFLGKKVTGTEEEGYVIRYASGVRAKVKLADYLEAHKLFTNTNERTVWGWLSTGEDLSGILAIVPDEYAEWVKKVAADLWEKHHKLICDVSEAYQEIMDTLPSDHSRKDFAEMALKFGKWSGPLFKLHEGQGQNVIDWAWKSLRPEGQTASAFSNNES